VLSADLDVLHDVHKRIEAVSKFRSHENFDDLAISFKRVVNIIPDGYTAKSVDTELLQMEAEKKLWEQFSETAKKVTPIKLAREYGRVLEIIPELKPHIDKFFDDVLVMAKEENLRENRLNLLCSIASLYSTIADFKKLGGIAEK